jgi:hypothetical protein
MKPEWGKPLPENPPVPSFAPPIAAGGLVLLLWGAVTHWILSAMGLILTGYAAARWIRDAQRRDVPMQSTAGNTLGAARRSAAPVPSSPHTTAAWAVQSVWVHRCALALAGYALAVVVTGAIITSEGTAASSLLQVVHLVLGVITGLLALYLCIRMRGLAWILAAAVLLEALLGGRSHAVGALHAFLAHLFFAASVATALVTSASWKRNPDYTDDMAKFSLRSLGTATVGLVLVQVALGAAVRHKLMGSGLHITFALVVALAIVILGVMVMNQCVNHGTLRPCSILMMVITGTQVFLGFSAFIVRMMADENTLPVMIATVAHVTTGSLTLAATVVLAFQLRRHLRPTPAGKPAVV